MKRTLIGLVYAFLMAAPAAADAIDGEWCSPDGKNLVIHGPEIITPSKVTMQGQYNRHQFAYVAPAGDDDAGTQIFLELLSEEEMNHYSVGKDGKLGEPILWRRCKVIS
jgi:hypothetical protein